MKRTDQRLRRIKRAAPDMLVVLERLVETTKGPIDGWLFHEITSIRIAAERLIAEIEAEQ